MLSRLARCRVFSFLCLVISLMCIQAARADKVADPFESYRNAIKVTPFRMGDVSNPDLCRYIKKRNYDRRSMSQLFYKVKDIYIFNSIELDLDNSLPKRSTKRQRSQDVSELAGCILSKYLGQHNRANQGGDEIYMAHVNWHRLEEPLRDESNLAIFIDGNEFDLSPSVDKSGEDHVPIPGFSIRVRFHRAGSYSDMLSYHFCSLSFAMPETSEGFHEVLTSKLQTCLQQNFVN